MILLQIIVVCAKIIKLRLQTTRRALKNQYVVMFSRQISVTIVVNLHRHLPMITLKNFSSVEVCSQTRGQISNTGVQIPSTHLNLSDL